MSSKPFARAEFAPLQRREYWAWAMYDFVNSGYTTVVITAVFRLRAVYCRAGAGWLRASRLGGALVHISWAEGQGQDAACYMLVMPSDYGVVSRVPNGDLCAGTTRYCAQTV